MAVMASSVVCGLSSQWRGFQDGQFGHVGNLNQLKAPRVGPIFGVEPCDCGSGPLRKVVFWAFKDSLIITALVVVALRVGKGRKRRPRVVSKIRELG